MAEKKEAPKAPEYDKIFVEAGKHDVLIRRVSPKGKIVGELSVPLERVKRVARYLRRNADLELVLKPKVHRERKAKKPKPKAEVPKPENPAEP